MEWLFWVLSVFGACSTVLLLKIVTVIWWKPLQVKKFFESQGIGGPPYRLLYGNGGDVRRMYRQALSKPMPWSHDIVPRVFPHVHHWNITYGEYFISWFGPKARLNVPDLELKKEILSNKLGLYEPADLDPISGQLLRQGLLGLKGEKWLQHRRIINPAFHVDALKRMIPIIVESATNMLEELSKLVLTGQEEFDMFKELRKMSGSVIARTAFGSNYEEGKNIFDMQAQLMVLTAEITSTSFYFPGLRFLPTRKNIQLWKLHKEIKRDIIKVIESRERIDVIKKSGSYGNDLLGIMMTPKKQQVGGKMQDVCLTKEEIVAECKTMYLAGHETASNLLTWAILLLGMHQDWQVQGRKEVLEVFGKDGCPNVEGLNCLKIVGMIVNETLRLYPAAVSTLRQSDKPVKLGNISIPTGTQLHIPILQTHHDPTWWGNDVNEFNPGRFSEGIGKAAKHPLAYTPFGFGPRICVGRDFALLEAKLVLAMFLQRFSFVTSPSYAHAPIFLFTLQPQHGAQVILKIN